MFHCLTFCLQDPQSSHLPICTLLPVDSAAICWMGETLGSVNGNQRVSKSLDDCRVRQGIYYFCSLRLLSHPTFIFLCISAVWLIGLVPFNLRSVAFLGIPVTSVSFRMAEPL